MAKEDTPPDFDAKVEERTGETSFFFFFFELLLVAYTDPKTGERAELTDKGGEWGRVDETGLITVTGLGFGGSGSSLSWLDAKGIVEGGG